MAWMQNFGFSHKLVAMVWCLLSTKGQGALEHKGGELVGENSWWANFFEELVIKKGEVCTMDGRTH